MAGRRRAIELAIGEEDVAALGAIARSRTESASRVDRARMLLGLPGRRIVFLRWGEPGARTIRPSSAVSSGRWSMARWRRSTIDRGPAGRRRITAVGPREVGLKVVISPSLQESSRFLLLLPLLWVCGQRVCVVLQAKRHIHSLAAASNCPCRRATPPSASVHRLRAASRIVKVIQDRCPARASRPLA